MVGRAPQRFVGLGAVPLQDLDAGIVELEYLMRKLRFAGVEIASHVDGTSIGDPRFEPFFAAAERLGAAIFVHALRPAGQERIVGPFSEQAVCFPGDIALAAASMITGGIGARHARLRIAFSHGGGALSILLPRLVHGWKMVAKARESLAESPAVTAKRFYYDNLVFDPAAIAFLVQSFGASQIVLGSDYPFAMGDGDPLGTLERAGFDAGHGERDHLAQCKEVPEPGMIAGSTALIEPPRTASATSSNGVGSALTITTFAPAAGATSTAPATG
jgi:aminocarboxymuconate-semialdehyde decarboxylase